MSRGRLAVLIGLLCLLSMPALAAEPQWQPGDAVDTILITYNSAASQADIAVGTKALLQAVQGRVDLSLPSIHLQRVRLPAGSDGAAVNAALVSFRSSSLVLVAEPDHPTKLASANLFNDPLYLSPTASQWYLSATAWPQAVAAFSAGSIQLQGIVTVAVVDTGVMATHLDLTGTGHLLPGASFVAGIATPDDQNGHGTFCTGLIAANTGNGRDMAGAFFDSSKIRILPVKALDDCGSGTTSDLVEGILYAVDQDARVISLSVQSTTGSTALENAVISARSSGVFLAVAAGNNYGASTSYPAAYSQAFAVGALDHADARASYSNFGKLELSAPGGDLSSFSGGCVVSANNCCPYEIWSISGIHGGCSSASNPACGHSDSFEAAAGTSFAAPLVAAAAALLFSQDPSRQVEDVERILMQTASATAYGAGFHSQSGWGKLNYYGALMYQSQAQVGSPIKAYNWPNPFSPDKDRLTTLTFFLPAALDTKLRLFDAGGDLVKQWDLSPGQAQAGMNLVTWDGRNGVGAPVANGAYTLAVDSGGKRALATVAVLH